MFGHADETDDTHPPSLTHPGTSVVPAALAIGERNRLCGHGGAARDRARLRHLRAHAAHAETDAVPALRSSRRRNRSGVRRRGRGRRAAQARCAARCASCCRMPASRPPGSTRCSATRSTSKKRTRWAACRRTTARGGVDGRARLDRRRRHVLRRARFLLHLRARRQSTANDMVRGSRQRLRNPAARHQALAGRRPDSGTACTCCANSSCSTASQRRTSKRLVARMPDKELEIVNNRDMPDISVQHLLAVMLLDGNVTFKSAHDSARMRDPKVLAVRERIEAVGDPTLTDAQRRWRCVMEVHPEGRPQAQSPDDGGQRQLRKSAHAGGRKRKSARPDRAYPRQEAKPPHCWRSCGISTRFPTCGCYASFTRRKDIRHSGVRRNDDGTYSALMPASLITPAHIAVSALIRAASSCGVLVSTSRP